MSQIYHAGQYMGNVLPGHTILDSSGIPISNQPNIQFNNATVTADYVNDKIIVDPQGGVTSFNGRSGSVMPVTGDYDIGVASFNGRSGSVQSIAGDYDATQVNYDANTTVKQKIDELTGGHTIVNSSDEVMPERSKMKFVNMSVTDDSTNDQLVIQSAGDYEELDNLPQINGHELNGNKTSADLELQGALSYDNYPVSDSTNMLKSGAIYTAVEDAKNYNNATNKPTINGVVLSGNKTTSDLGISTGTTNYDALSSKPQINGVTLSGNKSLSSFGIYNVSCNGYTLTNISAGTSDLTPGSSSLSSGQLYLVYE